MATSLSNAGGRVLSKPIDEYAWWKHHVTFFVVFFMLLPTLLTLYFGFLPLYRFAGVEFIVNPISNGFLLLFLAVSALTMITSWVAYYYDARYIDNLDVEWSPKWQVYMILHVSLFVGGPFIAVPVYIVQRLRHVGIPIFS